MKTKEFSIVTLGQIFSTIGNLFFVKIISDYLSPFEYGVLTLGFTIHLLSNQVFYGPLSNTLLRHFDSCYNDSRDIYLSIKNYFFKKFSLILVFFILAGIFFQFIIYGNINFYFYLSLIFYILFSGYNSIELIFYLAQRKRHFVFFYKVSEILLRIILIYIFSSIDLTGYDLAISAYLTTSILLSGLILYFSPHNILDKYKAVNKESKQFKSIKNYYQDNYKFGIFTWLHMSSDKWLLSIILSNELTGIYTLMYQYFFSPIIYFSSILQEFLTPILFMKNQTKTDYQKLVTCLKYSLLLLLGSFIGSLLIYFVIDYISNLLLNENYRSHVYLIKYIVVSAGFYTSAEIMALFLLYKYQTKVIKNIKIGASIAGILLNIIFIKQYGIAGIVYSLFTYSITVFFLINYNSFTNVKKIT